MKFILGKKIDMTQIFLPTGEVIPVTRIAAGPCPVAQVKKADKENSNAVQLGFGEQKEFRLSKPQVGHLKDLTLVQHLSDFAVESVDGIERGDLVTVETFVVGDKVNVIGVSKGKGFAGVVKRHHFAGGPASHGHKDNERAPGAIGAGGVQRVFKGLRMAGHMGCDQVTVKNLEIVEIHPETNELYIKGAVPGGRNSFLKISCPGELKTTKKQTAEASVVTEPTEPTQPVEPEVKVEEQTPEVTV